MTTGLRRGLSPVRTTLANGAVIVAQPTSMAPAVTIDCAFDAGSLFDPPDLPGVEPAGRARARSRHPAPPGRRHSEELDERGVALRVTTTRHRLSVS